jgi:hypothetical protein
MDSEGTRAIREQEEYSLPDGIEGSAGRYMDCQLTIWNKILLATAGYVLTVVVVAGCLRMASGGFNFACRQSFFSLEQLLLFITGIGTLLLIGKIDLGRRLKVRIILSLLKALAVTALAYLIMPALLEGIAGGMGYFTLMEMAGPKSKRKILWTAYLCLHIFLFIRFEHMTLRKVFGDTVYDRLSIVPRFSDYLGIGILEFVIRCRCALKEEERGTPISRLTKGLLDGIFMVVFLLEIEFLIYTFLKMLRLDSAPLRP